MHAPCPRHELPALLGLILVGEVSAGDVRLIAGLRAPSLFFIHLGSRGEAYPPPSSSKGAPPPLGEAACAAVAALALERPRPVCCSGADWPLMLVVKGALAGARARVEAGVARAGRGGWRTVRGWP